MNLALINMILKGIDLFVQLAPLAFNEIAKIDALRQLGVDFQANVLRLTDSAHADNANTLEAVEAWRKEHNL